MSREDRGGKKRKTGVRCVAALCGNRNADGFSLHTFPRNPSLRKQWSDFVRVKRAEWDGPTEYSAICSAHFRPECFPFRHRFEMEQTGKKPKKVNLNDDAVPTIHATGPVQPGTESSATPKTQHRMRLEMLSPSESTVSQVSPPKKIRRGYAKREAARIIAETVRPPSDRTDEPVQEEVAAEMETNAGYQEAGETLNDMESDRLTVGVQVNKKPSQRSRYCQTNTQVANITNKDKPVKLVSIGIQTDESMKPKMKDAFQLVRPHDLHTENVDGRPRAPQNSTCSDDQFSSPLKDDINEDPTFNPNSPFSSDSDNENDNANEQERRKPVEDQTKFLVFASCLLELFESCPRCCAKTSGDIMYINGSMVKIEQKCLACQYSRYWYSQPFVGGKPAGNLLQSAGILFSGSVPTKILKMYKFMNVPSISMSTYINHQKFYLYPSIAHVWFNGQKDYVNSVVAENRSVILAGDGRCDSPGHCAKYGSFNVMDLQEGVVVDIQLVQSNEVKNSLHMEKEGLIRSTRFFNHHNISIKSLITDGHKMIRKWMREDPTMKNTVHYLDVWHVAKGLKKKLVALSNEKDCKDLTPWIKSIINHLYWTAASSYGEAPEITLAKWLSIKNHIANKHEGHSPHFHSCQHGALEGRERHKKWLKPGTKVFEKLQDILSSNQLKKDVPMLSPGLQTSSLEGYHSVVNHFAPKMVGFSYHGMLCRLWLAALHFNENIGREQAVTCDGTPRYRIVYPKFKKGGYTVRRIPVDCTYDYVSCLMRTVYGIGRVSHMNEDGIQLAIEQPPPLCNDYERPDKEQAVQNLTSRFNRCLPDESQCSGQIGM